MKRVNKNGFTLVEMLLAIAIMLLISGLFVSLVIAIKDSFYRVYNDDDSTDYAMLYAQALENQILYDVQNDFKGTYYINTDFLFCSTSNSDNNQFTDDSHNTFATLKDFNKTKDGNVKWRIYLSASYESSTGLLSYTIYVVDNYDNPDTLVQAHSGQMWIPVHGSTYTDPTVTDPVIGVTSNGTASFSARDGSSRSVACSVISLQ